MYEWLMYMSVRDAWFAWSAEGGGVVVEQSTMEYAKRLAQLSLQEKDVQKVTKSRVTAMVVHPSEKTLLVVAGDVEGNLGVWQVRGRGCSLRALLGCPY
jgi:hypothetical protein